MPDTEILRSVLDRWKAGIDAGRPAEVAAVFAPDAVFQGLRPYSVGRQGVIDYYTAQPPGMTVTYSILETRRPAADVLHGYVAADFVFPDRPAMRVHVGVVLHSRGDDWAIIGYQASKLD